MVDSDVAKLREYDTGDYPVVWREEMEGLTARIELEQDSDHANPRDCDNLGEMLCWHPDYYLGDKQFSGAGRGAVKNRYEPSFEFESIGDLARKLVEKEQAVCVLPLYLFDHSGISISAGSNYVGRGDTACGGMDEFGNQRGWDTTLVGVIYTTPERVKQLCGEGKPRVAGDAGTVTENADGSVECVTTPPLYCPPDWEGTPEAWLEQQLRNEVELYDRYLRGEVYWYCVADEDDDYIDSCGGYLPDVGVPYAMELDYIRSEAHHALINAVEKRRRDAERERLEAERAANMDIATVGA